jgi:very-short-patch-repair endonuclease
MSLADQIQQLLVRKPGLKAQQIADELALDRAQVVAALHSLRGDEVTQDNAYRWWARAASPEASGAAPAPRTFLASLCRYYLECLSRESGSGVSIATDSSDYLPLGELPFVHPGRELWATDRALKKLVQKVRREQGQLTLCIGYAVRLRRVSVRNRDEMRIEPVLLYPVEERLDEPGAPLRPSSGIPLFNLEVLKSLPAADSGNIIDEAIHLSEELGLANPEEELPEWDEIVLRLQRCRPDWNWRENLAPQALSSHPPLAEITAPGIYNRAVLFVGTRSPYTYGLEIELRKLMKLDEAAVRETALGQWLRGDNLDSAPPADRPILEVLPLNTEQRQAVVQGLSAPLTVVTGPPGTGKSQVVTSLLANQAWLESSVLFASKNNHAVDVVESRTNDLGPYPLLLRLGKEEHHARVAQHLTSGLAETTPPDATARYDWLMRAHQQDCDRFATVQREIAAVMQLRNQVDEAEREAEPARALFGEERFAALRSSDLEGAKRRLGAFTTALDAAKESSHTAMGRLLGDSRGRRVERVIELARDLAGDADRLGVAAPASEPGIETWEKFARDLADRLAWAERVRLYGAGLEQLRTTRPLEQLARDSMKVAEESAHTSLELWQSWLRLRPSRWTPEKRRLLSEYVSLLQMIVGGDGYDEGAGRRVFRRYYSLFPKVARILPCWAVTSLSARGRLPFEPGFFDLVVIDEASQCDIASALPLLYRARRAVIIGDPLQLKHVSTVAPQQDRLLLAAHGLAEGHAAWAYSVNSLFDLARSWCRHEDIVNLRDHHRSHRDIISFSNRHFYRGALRIATDHERLKRPLAQDGAPGPAVRWHDVKGKVIRPPGGGALNGPEVATIVDEVRTLVVDRGYNGAIGVVTPFRAQANRIRTLVHQDRELTNRLAALQFVVDTVHGFQGDERDVIFFSPVVSLGANDSMLRFLQTHGNLFNVAITRARSELIVVGDRQAALDSGVSYLASFADYARDLAPPPGPRPSAADGPDYPPVEHPERVSEWERKLYRALHAAGLTPVPQYEEAPYTLDFALFHGDRKLDIEVDGENYHRNWDGELCRRDQIRSQRLADLGWDILRFWVYEIRDDLAGTVRRVRAWTESA